MSDLALPYVLPRVRNPELELTKYSNLLRALQARRSRASRVSALPIDLTIDLTTACQLRCPYCAVGNGTITRPRGRI
jgi:2-iminoacetate synthase ThiH